MRSVPLLPYYDLTRLSHSCLFLSSSSQNQLFFANAPMATWSQLSVVLQWQFSAATKRDLSADQLKMLGEKVCGNVGVLGNGESV